MLLAAALALAVDLPVRTHVVGPRDRLDLPTRDGTRLYTAWRLPKGPGPFPAVVTRSPYPIDPILDGQCRVLVSRGYACVWQDVRGRGRSEGSWIPFVHEEADGQDLVRWVSEQPWSNQKIAWIGDSYLASTGWSVAMEAPDGITTLISRVFAPDSYGSAYESGLMRHELATAWMTIMPDERDDMFAGDRYHAALAHRPRATLDLLAAGHPVDWYRGWLAAEDPTHPSWTTGEALRFARAPETTDMPVMMVGGWSDVFIEGQIKAWSRLRQRERGLLVVGAWSHLGQVPSDRPLPGANDQGTMFQYARVLDWLDVHLRGSPPRRPISGVLTYVVGGARWEQRDSWPPPTTGRRLAAQVGPAGASERCSGALVEGGPPLDRPMRYVYDPERPLPSRGGAGLLAGVVPMMGGVPPGFLAIEDRCAEREDVLRFVSAPLQQPLHFAGTPRVELEVSSDAEDSAFGFRLLERLPSGKEILLREGFATLALREGGPRQAYVPGERVRVVADSAPLEAELQPGSSVVLVLTSSSFPAYEAHPNVAGLLSEASVTRVAQQQVYAATLLLPEVDRRASWLARGSPPLARSALGEQASNTY